MSTSRTAVKRVSGYLEDEHGKDHLVSLDIEVLYTFVHEVSEVIKKATGIQACWVGAELPDGNYIAKFSYEGQTYRWPKRMVGGVLRHPVNP